MTLLYEALQSIHTQPAPLTRPADDGNTPTVGSIGPCTIDIYTGSKTVQTQLQNLAASVDVSKASSVSVTVDPTIGPNGDFYFIRVSSLSLKDTINPQYPYQAFSAKFELQGMTGNFTPAVLAQIQDAGSNSGVGAVSFPISSDGPVWILAARTHPLD